MGLKDYLKKRKFNQTSEPKGRKIKSGKQLHFVIQKHHASHLHYDFRLEMAGVLKSWAVPKGPSLNRQDKRLAVMVEDHPYDYKDFEGTIPKGNYGAGNVIIWDEGYFEPTEEISEDINEYFLKLLAKGHLSFILNGKKLNGEYSLIKLVNSEKNWLLIKKKDKFSSQKDILHQDQSVRSGFKVDEIDLKIKNLRKSSMPKKIRPMLAKLYDKPFNRKGWLYEIKWDGYRIIAYINMKRVQLLTRNQKDYTEFFF